MKRIFTWILSLFSITGLIYYAGPTEILSVLSKFNHPLFFFLVLLQILTLSVQYFVWHRLLNLAGAQIPYSRVAKISLAGSFVESVTPSVKFGGEAAKTYLFHRHTGLSYDRLTSVLMVQKFVSVLPFLILLLPVFGLAALYLNFPPVLHLLLLVGILLLLAATATVFYLNPATASISNQEPDGLKNQIFLKLQAVRRFVGRSVQHARHLAGAADLAALLALSTVIWLLYPLKLYLAAVILGIQVTPLFIVVVTYAAYLVSMFPLFPGGLGSYEGTAVLLFILNGYLPHQGLSLVLISRAVTFWLPLLVSGVVAAFVFQTQLAQGLYPQRAGSSG